MVWVESWSNTDKAKCVKKSLKRIYLELKLSEVPNSQRAFISVINNLKLEFALRFLDFHDIAISHSILYISFICTQVITVKSVETYTGS